MKAANRHRNKGSAIPTWRPSTADTYSLGIVLSPHQVPGLTLSADFFHVEEKNTVGGFPDVTILNSVNTLGPASPYASLVANGNYPWQARGHADHHVAVERHLSRRKSG